MTANQTQCPQCGTSWDGGDVLDVLVNVYGQEKGTLYAQGYNYGPGNRARFSRLVCGLDYANGNERRYWRCPDCTYEINEKN